MGEPDSHDESKYREVGGFKVATSHRTKTECPACEDVRVLFYLGSAEVEHVEAAEVVGWVCSECENELREYMDQNGATFDLQVVE